MGDLDALYPCLRSLVTMLDLDHGANENACVAEYKAKRRRLGR
jgi:hypothetical protein